MKHFINGGSLFHTFLDELYWNVDVEQNVEYISLIPNNFLRFKPVLTRDGTIKICECCGEFCFTVKLKFTHKRVESSSDMYLIECEVDYMQWLILNFGFWKQNKQHWLEGWYINEDYSLIDCDQFFKDLI